MTAQYVDDHVAGGGEPSSYTWTLGGKSGAAGAMLAYSGADTTDPIAAHSGQAATTKGTTITAPSVTGAPGDRLVGLFGMHGQHTIAAPASMTERTDIAQTAGSGQKVTSETADALLSTTGATGARVATADSSGYGVGQLIALRPMAGPPPNNQPPVIDSVSIDQSNPITTTVLSATITSHDPDGTPVSYTYQVSPAVSTSPARPDLPSTFP